MASSTNLKPTQHKFKSLEEAQYLLKGIKEYLIEEADIKIENSQAEDNVPAPIIEFRKPSSAKGGLVIYHELATVYIFNGVKYLDEQEAKRELDKYAERES